MALWHGAPLLRASSCVLLHTRHSDLPAVSFLQRGIMSQPLFRVHPVLRHDESPPVVQSLNRRSTNTDGVIGERGQPGVNAKQGQESLPVDVYTAALYWQEEAEQHRGNTFLVEGSPGNACMRIKGRPNDRKKHLSAA